MLFHLNICNGEICTRFTLQFQVGFNIASFNSSKSTFSSLFAFSLFLYLLAFICPGCTLLILSLYLFILCLTHKYTHMVRQGSTADAVDVLHQWSITPQLALLGMKQNSSAQNRREKACYIENQNYHLFVHTVMSLFQIQKCDHLFLAYKENIL